MWTFVLGRTNGNGVRTAKRLLRTVTATNRTGRRAASIQQIRAITSPTITSTNSNSSHQTNTSSEDHILLTEHATTSSSHPTTSHSEHQHDADHPSKHSAQHTDASDSESSHQRQASATAAAQSHAYVVAAELSDNFMRALHLSEQTRFVKGLVLGLSVLGIVGLFVWINRDNVKTSTAEQVADVAKRSLNSAEIQDQVNLLSQEVVHRLLTDPAVLNTALQFTTRLLHEPSTLTALSALVGSTLNHPDTLAQAKDFSTQLVQQLSASPDVQATVAQLVKQAINQTDNQRALIDLMRTVLNDPESKALLASTGSSSAHDVFNDPAVLDRATDFMKSVLADAGLQQQASDALWGAVRMTFKPKSIWGHSHVHPPPHTNPSTPSNASNPVNPSTPSSPSSIPVIVVPATTTPSNDVEAPEPVLINSENIKVDQVSAGTLLANDAAGDILTSVASNAGDPMVINLPSSNELIIGTDLISAINEKIALHEGTSSGQSASSLAPTFHIVVNSPVQPQQVT